MKKLFLASLFFVIPSLSAQSLLSNDKDAILKVLEDQRICWNNGDLEGYMEGYWKSDSLRFIGKNGIRYGWVATFESYRKGYPTKEIMGVLTFKVVSLEVINSNTAFMIGRWELERKENAAGYFSLLWKKINGRWVIITDHSS